MADERDGWGIASLVIATIMGVVVGAFVGALATFTHRQWRLPLGAFHPPLGLLVGVVLVGLIVAGLRLAFARTVAVGGAVGAIAAIAVLAIPGAGGTAVVVGDAIGWTWAIAPVVVCALILVWPARRVRRASEPIPSQQRGGGSEGIPPPNRILP